MKISWRLPVFAIMSLLILFSQVVADRLSSTHAAGTRTLPRQYFAPYQDMTLGPKLQWVAQSTGQKYFTLAFITSQGCDAQWGDSIPLNQTSTRLPHLISDIRHIRSIGGDVIISFGGAAGKELALACSSVSSLQQQYQRVIDTYSVKHLDFDIESGTQGDLTSYTRRNRAIAALQEANPGLTISFTLPSATTGLLSNSLGLIKNARANGVTISIVNLMTMDYGKPDRQMGQEAINAAYGLYHELKKIYPTRSSRQLWSMIGITSMIGQNDSAGEIFSLSNARKVLSFAKQKHIGELSMWEISRDNSTCIARTKATDTCSGVSQSIYAYTNIFKEFTAIT